MPKFFHHHPIGNPRDPQFQASGPPYGTSGLWDATHLRQLRAEIDEVLAIHAKQSSKLWTDVEHIVVLRAPQSNQLHWESLKNFLNGYLEDDLNLITKASKGYLIRGIVPNCDEGQRLWVKADRGEPYPEYWMHAHLIAVLKAIGERF